MARREYLKATRVSGNALTPPPSRSTAARRSTWPDRPATKTNAARLIRITSMAKRAWLSSACARPSKTAGGNLDDIVTMTVFITDMANGTRFTQLRKEFFKKAVIQPAR